LWSAFINLHQNRFSRFQNINFTNFVTDERTDGRTGVKRMPFANQIKSNQIYFRRRRKSMQQHTTQDIRHLENINVSTQQSQLSLGLTAKPRISAAHERNA